LDYAPRFGAVFSTEFGSLLVVFSHKSGKHFSFGRGDCLQPPMLLLSLPLFFAACSKDAFTRLIAGLLMILLSILLQTYECVLPVSLKVSRSFPTCPLCREEGLTR